MNNTLYAFLLTALAGLSTMIGTIPIFFKFNPKKTLTASFSFGIGVILTVSFLDLLPESSILLSGYFKTIPTILLCLIGFSLGMLIFFILDKYVSVGEDKLYRVGIISMIALIIHNLPEGVATYIASNENPKLGLSLAIAIALHNIPEGICIAVPIYHATKKRGLALLYTFISGMSELLAALLTYLFFEKYINQIYLGMLYSVIAGLMTHLAVYEMFPNLHREKNRCMIVCLITTGILVMCLSHILT